MCSHKTRATIDLSVCINQNEANPAEKTPKNSLPARANRTESNHKSAQLLLLHEPSGEDAKHVNSTEQVSCSGRSADPRQRQKRCRHSHPDRYLHAPAL